MLKCVESLVPANAAMWSLMKEQLGVTDEQLVARMQQLSALKGGSYARIIGSPKPAARFVVCPGCKRAAPFRDGFCVYCGESLAEAASAEPPGG